MVKQNHVTVEELKQYFYLHYSYISLDMSDEEIEEFLSEDYIAKCRDISQIANLLSDYVLSQGLASEVQE